MCGIECSWTGESEPAGRCETPLSEILCFAGATSRVYCQNDSSLGDWV